MTVISAGSLEPTAFSTVTVILNSVNGFLDQLSVESCRQSATLFSILVLQ